MIPVGSLRLVDDELENVASLGPASAEAVEPKVFVRTILVPAGLPWEQGQGADLEARNGSPLPIADVVYRIKRLEGWRPGAPGRFAAFYVLAKEINGQLEAAAQVDGKSIGVTFVSAAEDGRRAKLLGAVGIVVAAISFGLVLSVGLALTRRAETATGLEIAEQKAQVKFKGARAKERLRAQDRALADWPEKGARLSEVLADIAWVSSARDPAVRIEALHWDQGYIAVEARGMNPPLLLTGDRTLERSAKPIRKGVWLWGLETRTFTSTIDVPVAALPRSAEGGR